MGGGLISELAYNRMYFDICCCLQDNEPGTGLSSEGEAYKRLFTIFGELIPKENQLLQPLLTVNVGTV